MEESSVLTVANLRYLLVIQELDHQGKGVRCVDLAKHLEVTKPSVFAMIRTLRDMGLVTKEKYGTVHLTQRGRDKTRPYTDCYTLLLERLEQALGMQRADYRGAACAVLAETPESDLPLLRQRLRKGML